MKRTEKKEIWKNKDETNWKKKYRQRKVIDETNWKKEGRYRKRDRKREKGSKMNDLVDTFRLPIFLNLILSNKKNDFLQTQVSYKAYFIKSLKAVV